MLTNYAILKLRGTQLGDPDLWTGNYKDIQWLDLKNQQSTEALADLCPDYTSEMNECIIMDGATNRLQNVQCTDAYQFICEKSACK